MSKTLSVFFVAALLLSALVGCAGRSPATMHYVLSSGQPKVADSNNSSASLQLRKVDVPDYLDRNSIVTREPNNVRLTLAEYHKWAESLSAGMQRVLAEVLSPRLATLNVSLEPLDDDSKGPLQIFIQVLRFDGTLGADTTLDTRWTLRTQNDKIVEQGTFLESIPAGTTYDSLVLAQSQLLVRLGEHMAPLLSKATLNYAKRQ